MEILILGGTGWLGAEVANAALAAGSDVTCLARGLAGGVPEGARLIVADRDNPNAYADVANRTWDGIVDLARHPGHARGAVRALAGSTALWAFVSSGNVYSSHAFAGGDESGELLAPLDDDVMSSMEHYGAAKVACEQAVRDEFGDAALIARSGLIGGPGDMSGRSGYWPWRFASPSNGSSRKVLVPESEIGTSVIDVRDLARWLVEYLSGAVAPGTYDAVANQMPLADFLTTARDVAGNDSVTVPADTEWLVSQGVAEWMGERSLPLWLADPDWLGFASRQGAKIRAAGLNPRPLEETLRDVLTWEMALPNPGPHGSGLTDQQERALLDALAHRG